jgi:4-amino-4-deoxy-L-arabinose transferase-like glycosyltransferase
MADAHASRSVLGYLPWFWSRVLFAGTPQPTTSIRLLSVLLVVLLPALLLYPALGFPLFEPDESRYAQIPREMMQRGDLIVPVLQGEPYLDKPPLFYWLVVGSYHLFGVSEWSARLVPVLSLHLTVLLVYFMGRRQLGEPAALSGALLLSLAPGFISMGRLLLLDGLLTLWVTLALFSGFEAMRGPQLRRGWWLLTAVACGLGVLTKGPVILVLLIPPLLLHRWLNRTDCRLSRPDLALFALVVAGVALPWYVALSIRIPGFLQYFFWEHNVKRFLAPFKHEQGVLFYLPVLWVCLLPGMLLVWGLVRFLLSGDPTIVRRRTPELGYCLLAGGWCVLFFSLSACKLATYIMPAFPPLALALGYYLRQSRWQYSPTPAIVAGLMTLLLVGFHQWLLPWYADYRSPMGRDGEVARLCGDRNVVVVCYPRDCNAVPFYLGRSDVRSYPTNEIDTPWGLRALVRREPRVVVLCTHRNSFEGLTQLLPPEVGIVEHVHCGLPDIPGVPPRWMKPLKKWLGQTALGLGDVAVVQPRREPAGPLVLLAPKGP